MVIVMVLSPQQNTTAQRQSKAGYAKRVKLDGQLSAPA
ncbi:hypothetical protein RNAN_3311 [Rheinheimera nanhaiensis E407-8]|uniref:Uncharacterized protein n=1 Tax=Rheinheimera nanhaiensis E407-8 TaxID=562729 RepID=I1E1W1_9GAMM|nr:hypothetical protein RNAN_3311 [Rheinheimera nanhaiensis E407-8]